MSNLGFRMMSLTFRIRDLLVPPASVIAEGGLAPGQQVVDFGCGPGSITVAAAEAVGAQGHVYAVDVHPLAIAAIERRGLPQITTATDLSGIDDQSIDVVLLYDVFHHLGDGATEVLGELHRVLVPEGKLSFSDHHLKEPEILGRITGDGLFAYQGRGRRAFTFERV